MSRVFAIAQKHERPGNPKVAEAPRAVCYLEEKVQQGPQGKGASTDAAEQGVEGLHPGSSASRIGRHEGAEVDWRKIRSFSWDARGNRLG